MNAKLGRPKSKNPKHIEIRSRVDKITYQYIENYCKRNNLTRSDFLRKAIDFYLNKKD